MKGHDNNMTFELGETVATAAIMETIETNNTFRKGVIESFERYQRGDWGDLCEEDKEMNDKAIKYNDDRILARYNLKGGDIYIITEYDRSYTTIMFCDEY